MDFKNKLGTVDAHNLNLNFEPDNTDSHNIILNFEHLADGSTNLNFGDDVTAVIDTVLDTGFSFEVTAVYAESGANTAVIDTVLDTRFSFDVVAVFKENTDVIGQIDTVLDTSFSFEVEAVFSENLCIIDTVLDTEFQFEVKSVFDINHLVGVSCGFDMRYQKAIAALSTTETPWARPILRVSNEALFYDPSVSLSQQIRMDFENGLTLSRAIQTIQEQSTGLSRTTTLDWQKTEKRLIHQRYVHDEGLKRTLQRQIDWQEMLRRRKTLSYAHEVAEQLTHCFSFAYDLGLEIVTKAQINWDQAKAIHYRKHKIESWPTPKKPKYIGNTDLNFICLCHGFDSHNIVLNFGAEDCIPELAKKKWWYVLNHLHAERLDTGEKIIVLDGSYSCSRDTWCWSHSITVAHTEKAKLQPINDQPVILKLLINGFEHHVLLETDRETIKFADRTYTYSGRSITALNSSDYTAKRSFIQDNDRSSVQLVQAELDRALANTQLDWQLIDDVGWPVAAQSLSYAELAPMDAIKQVVESGGGFIYSQKAGNRLTILPKYKKGYWDVLNAADYDILINESAVIEQTIEKNPEYLADYNTVTLVNSRSGDDWKIKQRNSAGDIPFETTVGPMFDVMSAQSNGKMQLIQANVQELHTFAGLPITSELGEMLPGKTIAFGGQWWGVIDSVSGSYSHSEATETIKVERIHRDQSII